MNRLMIMLTLLAAGTFASAQSVQELRKQVDENPTIKTREALADAYLRECMLEESLEQWRAILKDAPQHPRARLVVERLTVQALDLDSHLKVLESLIESDASGDVRAMLAAAGQRAANDEQKATILYLRGLERQVSMARVRPETPKRMPEVSAPHAPLPLDAASATRPSPSLRVPQPVEDDDSFIPNDSPSSAGYVPGMKESAVRPMPAEAKAAYLSAMKLYPNTVGAARSAMAMAKSESADEARRLLKNVVENASLADAAVKELAALELALLDSADASPKGRIAAIQSLAERQKTPEGRRAVQAELMQMLLQAQERWTADAVAAAGAILADGPANDQALDVLSALLEVARTSQDAGVLDAVVRVASGEARPKDASLAAVAKLAQAEALLSKAVLASDVAVVRELAEQSRRVQAAMAAGQEGLTMAAALRAVGRRGRLVEAQKFIALNHPADALPVLLKAKDACLAGLAAGADDDGEYLQKVAFLLESLREWEIASAVYREVAGRFPHLPVGRDALWRAAELCDEKLDAPMEALDLYAQYAARYPAELPYRQLAVGRRLERLGYANVLDFQKRNGLKPDGLFYQSSIEKLQELEEQFEAIRAEQIHEDILRGRYVHPVILGIAKRLEKAGQHYQAILAYRLFVNLYPTKKDADDSLLSIARMLRDNLLFDEALGAYQEMMEDFPKGDKTSLAYIEAAGCCENLGRWKQAREFYDLYVKKFPQYEHVALCQSRMALLEEIQQYEDLIATNPDNPKLPEARYQIASLLYQKLGNPTKAAVEFEKIAALHAAHVRAPDGLFTAGAAYLRAENFPAARKVFMALVEKYPDSRLADDAQFWVGHTYEYAARAMGKLDDAKIVLKRRNLSARAELTSDIALRKHYFIDAKPGAAVSEAVWGGDTLGVLASGSVRDRVNADLFRAIEAYRVVADKFKTGDMAGAALLRIGTIYTKYLKDPDKGSLAYQELLAHYPGTEQAVDALFEVGAYHFDKKNYEAAVTAYQQFAYNYPKEAKVEDAMMAIAKCYVEQKLWDKALDAYQRYLAKYPQGKHAATAKMQVEWIRMYHF